MVTSLIGLGLAYALLLFLLLLALLRSEIGVGAKSALLLACAGFYIWHFQALQASRGWPASDRLPARFEIIDSLTVEPDLQNDREGAIYVWVRDLDAAGEAPRAYRFDYDRLLHRQVDESQRKAQSGERQVGVPQAGGSVRRPRIEFESLQRNREAHKSGDRAGAN